MDFQLLNLVISAPFFVNLNNNNRCSRDCHTQTLVLFLCEAIALKVYYYCLNLQKKGGVNQVKWLKIPLKT